MQNTTTKMGGCGLDSSGSKGIRRAVVSIIMNFQVL